MRLRSADLDRISEGSKDRAVIGTEKPLLGVGVLNPVLEARAAENVINTTAEVPRPGILLRIPAGVHSWPVWVELSTYIPEDRLLTTFISLANDSATKDDLVEEATGWHVKELIHGHVLLS